MNQNLRHDRSALTAELARVGVRFKGKACHCPYHDDIHPSAGIYADAEGVWRFKCHGCGFLGDIYDVQAKNGGTPIREAWRQPEPEKLKVYPTLEAIRTTLPTCEAVYQYTNPDTQKIDLAVFRYRRAERKAFLQARPEGAGFILKGPAGLWPLYNRTRIKTATEVVVVEGEKCVHALQSLGLVATTAPGGAGKAQHADWTPLTGKTIYLWADNDAKGVQHMKDVEAILLTLNCVVRWIDHESLDLAEKGDAADFIARNSGTSEENLVAIQLILEEAAEARVTDALEERLGDMVAGRWKNYSFPWGRVSYLAKALLPGTVTCLPGDPGGGKSFFLLEAMWYWHAIEGIRVALYELEEDRTYHLHRALAQIAGNASLVDDEWVRTHAAETQDAFLLNQDLLESFGRRITDAPDKMVTLDELAEWVEAQFSSGCEIVGIDPVTAARVSDKPWLDDQRFMFRVKTTARKTGGRLILVTHPRIGQSKTKSPQVAAMAGGSAYGRFSQTVLWLKKHDERKVAQVYASQGGCQDTEFDRSVYITKARNGSGAGAELAYHFDHTSLRFEEIGLVREQPRVGVPS